MIDTLIDAARKLNLDEREKKLLIASIASGISPGSFRSPTPSQRERELLDAKLARYEEHQRISRYLQRFFKMDFLFEGVDGLLRDKPICEHGIPLDSRSHNCIQRKPE